MIRTMIPVLRPMTRAAFVAPGLPDPLLLRSIPRAFAMIDAGLDSTNEVANDNRADEPGNCLDGHV